MEKSAFFVVIVLALTLGGQSVESLGRRKRFLDESFLPESLLRFGQQAEHFVEKFSSDAQKTLDNVFTKGVQLREDFRQVSPLNPWRSDDVPAPQERTQNSELEKEDFEPVVDVVDIPTPPVAPQAPLLPRPVFHGAIFRFPLSSFGFFTPWWKGPNVCVERSEVEEKEENDGNFTGMNFSFESTQCVPTESTYVCTTRSNSNGIKMTMVVKHQCCHGFSKRTDGRPGCIQVKMDNLIDTMNDLGATRFAHAIESFNLKERILNGNFTVFCPTNEAMIDFEDEIEDNEIRLDRRLERRSTSDKASVVSGHIAEGFYNYDTMDNEQIVNSINDKSIRINKYLGLSAPVFTANCVPVTTKNHFATNGIIHFIPEVLQFPKKSVAEIIESDPQFSILRELLTKSGLYDTLKDLEKTWTIFAPTDDAFKAMDSSLLMDLQEGNRCVRNTLRQHMIQRTICTSAISGRIHVQNLLENRLLLTKDEDDKISIDGKQLLDKNILGTNGVVHIIGDVLIPPQAKSILETLKEAGRTDLVDLIETANLVSTFNKFENVTFFAPCKDAVEGISNTTREEWQENPDKLKDILLYHVVSPMTSAFAFQNNQELPSLLEDKTIHIKLHEAFPGIVTSATAQCARVVNSDNEACGAYVHVINKVLTPPKENILASLGSMEGYDTFRKVVEKSGLESRLQESGPFTLLAPTDEAFTQLDEEELKEMLDNKTRAGEIVKMHILPEMLCCTGVSQISPFHRQYVKTEEGSLLPLHRNLHNRVRFGRARAVKCDIMAENGIIHAVNRVLVPPKRIKLMDFDLFSFF